MKKWNIEIRKHRYNAKYYVDTSYFDNIDSEDKAYFLGLLFADGHVSKANDLMLVMKDYDIIKKFKEKIKADANIKYDRYGSPGIVICSKDICDSLREKGFTNRKSYSCDFKKVLNSVPKELENHFVRGLFDGDGSIRIYEYDYSKNPMLHFGYTGLEDVVQYVKDYLGIKTKTVKESNITYTCVSSCKETIKHIFEVLYKGSTIYIKRKYDTFLEII